MKTLSKILFLIILTTLVLAGCSGRVPNIPFLNSPTPTVTNTPTPTNTLTPSLTPTFTPTITFTPTPAVPISCSDQNEIKKIVDKFLKKNGYESYEAYLETLPDFSCDEDECTYNPADTHWNRWYQTAIIRGAIIGSFEIRDVKNHSNGQTCLLFANKNFSEPLPILGAIEKGNRYVVSMNELGKHLYTRAMSREKFSEWLSLHEGRIIDLGIILHLYDEATYEQFGTNPRGLPRDNFVTDINSIIRLPDSYTNTLSGTSYSNENLLDVYEYNLGFLSTILSSYNVLFPTNVSYIENLELDMAYYAENPSVYETKETQEHFTIYGDFFGFGFKDIYVNDTAAYAINTFRVYDGKSAVRLDITKHYVQFTPSSWSFPLSINDYDYVEFYIRTGNAEYRLYVTGSYANMNEISGFGENILSAYETQPTWVDFSKMEGYEHLEFSDEYYAWLGVIPALPSGSPSRWKLIRIPTSLIGRDSSQEINGIKLEFIFPSVPSNTVYLDEFRLVQYK